jgi:hypothetical protein
LRVTTQAYADASRSPAAARRRETSPNVLDEEVLHGVPVQPERLRFTVGDAVRGAFDREQQQGVPLA